MLKKSLLTLIVATVAITGTTYAQYAGDVLRFSESNYASSARFKAMGGAQIGVGGDLSSLGGNPAGLGLFTKSEFNFSPEFSSISTGTRYFNQGYTTDKVVPFVGQIGAAFYLPAYNYRGNQNNSKGALSFVLGLGYNRVADYNNEFTYGGVNSQNSFADYFAEIGGATSPGNLNSNSLEKWAYDNYLISYDNSGYYYPETYVNNNQKSTELRKGSSSEFNVSGAVNISNELYVGVALNFINLNYTRDAQFNENGIARGLNINGVPTGVNTPYDFTYGQHQVTTGEGVNGRLGVIFRPVPQFRIGATLQTPTWLEVKDVYTENLDNRKTANGTNNSNTYDYTYNIKTPLKGSFGASYVVANTALLTADLDYIDYASARISDPYTYETQLVNDNNTAIRNRYQEAINYRLGAEIKISNISIRGGYAYNGSPYKDNEQLYSQVYTGGLGFRVQKYSVDLAYQRLDQKSSFSPYNLDYGVTPSTEVNMLKNNVMLTIGARF